MKLDTQVVEFVQELYPRLREDNAAIERYRASIDKLPPIVVARGRILVDGHHRLQAHKLEGIGEIEVEDLGDISDSEIFNESIRRNSTHGHQLSAKDKANLAGKLWQTLAHLPNAERTSSIAELLAVSERAVQTWTKDARGDEKKRQQEKAWDLWLDCKSERQVASEIDADDASIHRWVASKAQECGNEAPDSRQHFDVWNFQTAAGDSNYFGKMAPQIVENLLWLYTEPGQIVVDPFAGGGTTIDVAKEMGRRVWASDRKPATPTLPIHKHDITQGWPEAAPNKADFILLDPPYWMQAKGRYSEDSEDLGNMTLEDFLLAWKKTLKICGDHLSGYLAFIVSPAEDKANDRVVDLAFEMYSIAAGLGFNHHRRIIATYNTQQATGQQVTWARENRKLLKLYRDIVVMSK